MNDFRLQTAIQMNDGHLSLHPAASTLKTMIPKDLLRDQALQLPALPIEPANEVNKDDTDMQDSESDDEGDFELHTVNTTSSEVCI